GSVRYHGATPERVLTARRAVRARCRRADEGQAARNRTEMTMTTKKEAPRCGRSEITPGDTCHDVAETVVEWMPRHLRASHAAAGGSGSYPANGAQRTAV